VDLVVNMGAQKGESSEVMLGPRLMPCPFCGETPAFAKHFREEMWRLMHRCKAVGFIEVSDWGPREWGAKKWNTRVP
jgi:hypothetical protein